MARPSPLIADLPEVGQALADAAEAEAEPGDETALGRQLAGLPQAEQDRILIGLVRAEAAAILGHASPADLEAGRAFSDLGFDSLTAVELRNRLNAATGLRLPVTLMFDYPDPAALASHLRAVISASAPLPVLAELEKLESMLYGTISDDDDASARITARLEAVVLKWKESREQGDEAGNALAEKASLAEQLESSSDDEVFDFLGKELGIFEPE
jgi:acyl carrier protein